MRGLLSAAPAVGPVRMILGTHLLLLVQNIMALGADLLGNVGMHAVMLLVVLLAIAALIAAVFGEPADGRSDRGGRHGGD
jgi:hypothetical protein